MESCRPLLNHGTDRARLLPTSKQSLHSAVALLKAIVIVRHSGVAVSRHRVFSSGAPRKNHTSETRRLAGPTQDVGSAGRRESVSAGLRMYKVGEA